MTDTTPREGSALQPEEIRRRLDIVEFAVARFGGEPIRYNNGRVKLSGAGHGGLWLEPEKGVWYHFTNDKGGDAIDLVGYALFGDAWDRHDGQMLVKAREEATVYLGGILSAPAPAKPVNGARPQKLKGPTPREKWKHSVVATYEYTDALGRRFFVDRTRNKEFPVWHIGADGKEVGGKGEADWSLYYRDEVVRAVAAGVTVFLCEGEKDAANVRALGLVATTAPGGSNGWSRAERTKLFAEDLRGADVVLLPDNDESGQKCMSDAAAALAGTARRVRILVLPELPEKGDVSDWIAGGGTLQKLQLLVELLADDVRASSVELQLEGDAPEPTDPVDEERDESDDDDAEEEALVPINTSNARSLRELAPAVNRRLNKRTRRLDKQRVAESVINWLVEHDRLLCDISNPDDPVPYIIDDDGAAVAVVAESRYLKLAISEAGINASEPVFTWLVNDLQARGIRQGRKVVLEHFTAIREQTLYVSSGRSRMVVARHGEPLRIAPNGEDDVLFAGEFVLPPWTPGGRLPLSQLQAFQPTLMAPHEAPDYTPEAQHLLLETWVLAAFMGIRPLPILTPVGQKGSGKSTTAKIIAQIFKGSTGGVSSVPKDQSAFNAAMSALPIYVIDNLDTEPQPWMVDAMATACTGGIIQERKYYTNFELTERRLNAALAVTTRTAIFAERADIKERLLPIFYGEIAGDMIDEKDIERQVLRYRNEILSELAIEAASVLGDPSPASGRVSRFQGFAKLATRNPDVDGVAALSSWIKASSLGVTDNDPLLQAIIDYQSDEPLRGTATEIIKKLSDTGADIPHQGGGKRIARKIREMKSALMMAGFTVREQQARDRTYFEIERARSHGLFAGEGGLIVGMSETSEMNSAGRR